MSASGAGPPCPSLRGVNRSLRSSRDSSSPRIPGSAHERTARPRLVVQPHGGLAKALLASQFGQRQERVGDLDRRYAPLGELDRTADCLLGLLKLAALLMNLPADRERERLRPVLSEAVLVGDRLRFGRVGKRFLDVAPLVFDRSQPGRGVHRR